MGKNNPRQRKSVPVERQVPVAKPVEPSTPVPDADEALSEEPVEFGAEAGGTSDEAFAVEPDEASVPPEPSEAKEALARQQALRQQRIQKADAVERKRKRRRRIRRAIIGVLVALVLLFGGLLIAFGIFRWYTYDDAADIQGTWYHEGTTMPVTITEDEIKLTDEVAYKYELDPEAKTITFRFGNMEGGGRYRFSLDRSEVAIADGAFDGGQNFVDDALWTASSLFRKIFFAEDTAVSEGGEGISVFSKESPSGRVEAPFSAE